MNGKELIAQERMRQIEEEGWTSAHDDEHTDGTLGRAAAVYIATAEAIQTDCEPDLREELWDLWPWDLKWYKPGTDPIRCLVKAGALIAAEIDRLQRKEGKA